MHYVFANLRLLVRVAISLVPTFMRQVIIYPGKDGYWISQCPSLPGCISQGKTKEEAIINIKEAIQLYIGVLQEKGQPIPPEHFDTLLIAV
jgi:predicted RNase H-like HicB family nuclease